MNEVVTRYWIAGSLFLIIFGLGYWLSRLVKPYPVMLLTVHKLFGLGALIYLIVSLVRLNRVAPLSPLTLVFAAAGGVFFVATIVTGGLVSIEKPLPVIVGWLHKVTPYLTLTSTAATLWLLAN
jgi:hypothetical protein